MAGKSRKNPPRKADPPRVDREASVDSQSSTNTSVVQHALPSFVGSASLDVPTLLRSQQASPAPEGRAVSSRHDSPKPRANIFTYAKNAPDFATDSNRIAIKNPRWVPGKDETKKPAQENGAVKPAAGVDAAPTPPLFTFSNTQSLLQPNITRTPFLGLPSQTSNATNAALAASSAFLTQKTTPRPEINFRHVAVPAFGAIVPLEQAVSTQRPPSVLPSGSYKLDASAIVDNTLSLDPPGELQRGPPSGVEEAQQQEVADVYIKQEPTEQDEIFARKTRFVPPPPPPPRKPQKELDEFHPAFKAAAYILANYTSDGFKKWAADGHKKAKADYKVKNPETTVARTLFESLDASLEKKKYKGDISLEAASQLVGDIDHWLRKAYSGANPEQVQEMEEERQRLKANMPNLGTENETAGELTQHPTQTRIDGNQEPEVAPSVGQNLPANRGLVEQMNQKLKSLRALQSSHQEAFKLRSRVNGWIAAGDRSRVGGDGKTKLRRKLQNVERDIEQINSEIQDINSWIARNQDEVNRIESAHAGQGPRDNVKNDYALKSKEKKTLAHFRQNQDSKGIEELATAIKLEKPATERSLKRQREPVLAMIIAPTPEATNLAMGGSTASDPNVELSRPTEEETLLPTLNNAGETGSSRLQTRTLRAEHKARLLKFLRDEQTKLRKDNQNQIKLRDGGNLGRQGTRNRRRADNETAARELRISEVTDLIAGEINMPEE